MELFLNETFDDGFDVSQGFSGNAFVSEVFATVQRVIIKEAEKKGHGVGSALSLESGWDFLKEVDRREAVPVGVSVSLWPVVCFDAFEPGQGF